MSGLYSKFLVKRSDGRDEPGGDKQGAEYFVLDFVHDPFARQALEHYAEVCEHDYPNLASDLLDALERTNQRHAPWRIKIADLLAVEGREMGGYQ